MTTAVYAFSHFAVDLGCAFAVFSACSAGSFGFLLYNFFAFAMQMPLGVLADHLNRHKLFALCGGLVTAICCCLPSFGVAGACLVGLGNALFHIGGGLAVMDRADSKAAPLGVFVSPGAMGIYLGALLGKAQTGQFAVITVLLIACVLMAVLRVRPAPTEIVCIKAGRHVFLPVVLLFAVVVLRSYSGLSGVFPWKSGMLATAAVCMTVLGKALGGILSDRLGAVRVSLCSLCFSAVLFFFSAYPLPGLFALLLFNMTMPITLHTLAQRMQKDKGFSFGLLTFALFLGFLPSYFGVGSVGSAVLAIVSLVSAALLLPALKAGERA